MTPSSTSRPIRWRGVVSRVSRVSRYDPELYLASDQAQRLVDGVRIEYSLVEKIARLLPSMASATDVAQLVELNVPADDGYILAVKSPNPYDPCHLYRSS